MASQQTSQQTAVQFRGLDLNTPYDMLKDNRSPFARNFRLYAERADDRRVAVSSRMGQDVYLNPLDETQDTSNTTNTGGLPFGVSTNWRGTQFTPEYAVRLTRVDLLLRNVNGGTGAIVVSIYADDGSGNPAVKIAESGILGSETYSSFSYIPAHFIEVPILDTGSSYWIMVKIQDDGAGEYEWGTGGTGVSATSNNGGSAWTTDNSYGHNFKTWFSYDMQPYGLARYTPDNGQNQTIIAAGTKLYKGDDTAGTISELVSGITVSPGAYYFGQADNKLFWVNGVDSLKTWNGTAVETITHANLPILSLMTFHYNLLVGVSASDPNKLIFSEAPGNSDGSGNYWYKAFLSTSFIYIPAPHANDPITAIVSFQNSLHIFTSSNKYVLYGDSPGNFTLRQATGVKGAISARGVLADKDYIYFVSDDGLYRYNGTTDELISDRVQPEFDNIADLGRVTISDWNRTIRFYYPSRGNSYNNKCLIWHKAYQEWMLDTDTYVSYAIGLTDANDPNELIELSSRTIVAYYAEKQFSNAGKAIDFKYWLKYDSYGDPGRRKRIMKLYPLLQGQSGNYFVYIKGDKDMENSPQTVLFPLETGGLKIGEFTIGDGSKIGGQTSFKPKRVKFTGYAYYWQFRVERNAINNPISFMGFQLSIRKKKL